jgi:hypothetical protein
VSAFFALVASWQNPFVNPAIKSAVIKKDMAVFFMLAGLIQVISYLENGAGFDVLTEQGSKKQLTGVVFAKEKISKNYNLKYSRCHHIDY